MGYHRAGFDVFGVDIKPQPRYPFERIQSDALEYVAAHGHEFDAIHASPPCQHYSACKTMHTCQNKEYPDLIAPTRDLLKKSGKPYVIENVKGSPLIGPVKLTGIMFNLKLHRERWFESSEFFLSPELPGYCGQVVGKNGFVCMAGHGDSGRGRIPADHRTVAAWKSASGIDWMTQKEMAQAIPPAYTEYIGKELMKILKR